MMEGVIAAVGFLPTLLVLAFMVLMAWWHLRNHSRIDKRLAECDASLLHTFANRIEEVTQAPPGSVIQPWVSVALASIPAGGIPAGVNHIQQVPQYRDVKLDNQATGQSTANTQQATIIHQITGSNNQTPTVQQTPIPQQVGGSNNKMPIYTGPGVITPTIIQQNDPTRSR